MRYWPFDRFERTMVAIGLALICGGFVSIAFFGEVGAIALIVGLLVAGAPFGARML